jgi:Na+/melibiose symporter-like transporter
VAGVILGNGIILGFTLPLHFSLMAFSDDYGEWKTGVRSSGMNFAFNLFFIKLAWASSAGIISLVFIYVAYQPGAENQTASSLAGITSMETLLPALFHLLLAFDPRLQAQQSDDGAHCQRPAHASRSALRSPSCLLWKSICTN